ncbi:MAG: MaoC family dehydratase [Paraglaciecola sp.]|nr:MaoC family dehydratase [Paraglaciecola sp.]MDP5131275.1 MaoC family dehydratase [Paraglaciecola sp.]
MFFEDFYPGQTAQFGAYLVTEAEIKEFAGKYDPQFFHLDNEAAKHSLFGGLCASGWHTASMFMRMLIDSLPEEHGSLGSPGINNLRWLHPVYPGYILNVKSTVSECRLTESKPGVGLVCMNYQVLNQDGLIVMSLESKAFFKCKNI